MDNKKKVEEFIIPLVDKEALDNLSKEINNNIKPKKKSKK